MSTFHRPWPLAGSHPSWHCTQHFVQSRGPRRHTGQGTPHQGPNCSPGRACLEHKNYRRTFFFFSEDKIMRFPLYCPLQIRESEFLAQKQHQGLRSPSAQLSQVWKYQPFFPLRRENEAISSPRTLSIYLTQSLTQANEIFSQEL